MFHLLFVIAHELIHVTHYLSIAMAPLIPELYRAKVTISNLIATCETEPWALYSPIKSETFLS